METFYLNSHHLGKDPCYIIAEIGSNHDKKKARAFEMIRCAAKAGANAVKFQLFKADNIAANIDLPETRLDDQFAKFGNNVYSLYKDMELPEAWLNELKWCCEEEGVDFLATPFDEGSADRLVKIGVSALKVSSFEITHIPLLKHIARLKLPILLSTGMANLKEIKKAVDVIIDSGEERISILHCGIDYPQPFETVNLRCMETLRDVFHCPVGYSDHTKGIMVPIAAVALGAKLYEKHVTLPEGKSPDHDFALTMDEFGEMVKAIRQCEVSLGSNVKDVQENEYRYRLRGRRSIFVVKDIKCGEVFTIDHLAVLRPGIGIAPDRYDDVLGKKATKNIKSLAVLREGDWD
jgi:sialic acid synthase SpsE